MKSPLAGISTGNVIMAHKSTFLGLNQECFNPAMLHILDRFFTGGYYEHMSREQEAFVRRYINLAGKVTANSLNRLDLPHDILQFDRFLGNYKG